MISDANIVDKIFLYFDGHANVENCDVMKKLEMTVQSLGLDFRVWMCRYFGGDANPF